MAANMEIDIVVNDPAWPQGLEPVAERAIAEAIAVAGPDIAGPAELSVLLTNDAEQRALNRDYRGKDTSTNVLSFPQIEPFMPVEGLVGDISFARETVEREANEMDIAFEHHFTHLLVHGFLHLLGYDHETEEEALVMEELETQILGKMGIADPYASG